MHFRSELYTTLVTICALKPNNMNNNNNDWHVSENVEYTPFNKTESFEKPSRFIGSQLIELISSNLGTKISVKGSGACFPERFLKF